MTDISPTIAALLHIQMPSGCIGTPITEIMQRKKREDEGSDLAKIISHA
jgi:hypothetical protein